MSKGVLRQSETTLSKGKNDYEDQYGYFMRSLNRYLTIFIKKTKKIKKILKNKNPKKILKNENQIKILKNSKTTKKAIKTKKTKKIKTSTFRKMLNKNPNPNIESVKMRIVSN